MKTGWIRTTLFLLAGSFSAACQTGRDAKAQWVETTAVAPSESVVWEVALQALAKQKFPLGAGVDQGARVATTGWKNSLAPFKGQGYRQRARLRLEPLEGGKYKLFLQVEMDTNEDIFRPMELEYAKWETHEDDVQTAQILISEIDARIGAALEVGEKKAR